MDWPSIIFSVYWTFKQQTFKKLSYMRLMHKDSHSEKKKKNVIHYFENKGCSITQLESWTGNIVTNICLLPDAKNLLKKDK